jgi:carboxymethylenebutenolidase
MTQDRLAPTRHTVPTPEGAMPAHLWLAHTPGEPDRPGLVVFQEIFGVSAYVRDRCADLAAMGYAVLAPEVYWRLEDVVIDETAEDFLQQAVAVAGRVDWDATVKDGVTAAEHLGNLPTVSTVGVLGFCFGGGLAFNVAAQADPAPAVMVSYYGSALPGLTDLAPQVTCPSLHHFGTADDYVPMEQVEAIRAAVTEGGTREDVEFHLHDGAGHAFDNPHPAFHHAAGSAAAWEQTSAFLSRHLPTG